MKFTILRKELYAMRHFAATKDVRYYLCGVNVVRDNRGTYMQATNGHILGRALIDGIRSDSPLSVTLPIDLITAIKDTKRGDSWLHFTIEGQKIEVIDNEKTLVYQAVDGNFPDCDRVIPLVTKTEEIAPAGYNPEYLMAFQKFAEEIKGSKKGAKCHVSILQRGQSAGIVNVAVDNFVGVIMPVRDCDHAIVPEWCYKPAKLPLETTETA